MLQATGETNIVQTETVRGVSKEEHRRMEDWLKRKIEAGKKEPNAEIIGLTPCLAQLLLARNPINRPISKRNSDFLASDIATGRFEFNGESIVVSGSGVLLDGQHRCQQVIATGKSITTVIVFGPKERARFTIDTGKPKTTANFLSMKDHRYSVVLSAALGYLLQWRKHGFVSTKGEMIPTTAEKLAAMDENLALQGSVEFTSPATKTVRAHAVLAFCHYVFAKRAGKAAADEFIRKLIDGDGLRKGDAIHYCRNRLLGMARGYAANDRCELVFKCWNKWRLGGLVTTFRFTGGELPKVER